MARARTAHYVIRPTSVGLLARGKDYSVRDLGGTQAGYTNLVEKELGVSLVADRGTTRYTQLHELSHVKHSLWTPERIRNVVRRRLKKELPVDLILVSEDARINELLLRAVPDAHAGYRFEGEALRMDLAGYVASHATPAVIRRKIREGISADAAARVDARLAEVAKASTRQLRSVWETTVPLALWLLEELTSSEKPKPSEEGEPGEPEEGEGEGDSDADAEEGDKKEEGGGSGGDASAPEEDSDDSSAAVDEPEGGDTGESAEGVAPHGAGDPPMDEPPAGTEGGPEGDGGEEGDADADEVLGEPDADGTVCAQEPGKGERELAWVIPKVLEPELRVPVANRSGNTAIRSSDTGTALRWSGLHRMQTDGVVFRKTRRRPGALQRGTVLIDMSSSMSLDNATIEMLIDNLPHATIAGYRGSTRLGKAWIVVLARNGRRVDMADVPYGGGNMCDGPALLWLSRQQRPLVWVCDGYVTGTGDSYSTQLVEECAAIMRVAGIVQVARNDSGLGAYSCLQTTGAPSLEPESVRKVLREIECGRIR